MATTVTKSEAEVALDFSPNMDQANTIEEDLIGYSDDEAEQLSGEPVVGSKSDLLDLPAAADLAEPDVELDINLSENFPDEEVSNLNEEIGIDALDGNIWDLQDGTDAAQDEGSTQNLDAVLDGTMAEPSSGAPDKVAEDNLEEGTADDADPAEGTVDSAVTSDKGPAEINEESAGSAAAFQERSGEDALHEIDYDHDEPSASQPHDSTQSQMAGEETAGDEDPVAQDLANPFANENAVAKRGTTPGSQDDEQALADETRHESRSLEDRALDEALYGDSSAASLDTPMESENELPEVVVSWHGVDYPLLYDSPGSEGKQCFFEDGNLLHCSMEELLASFRRELSDDLTSTDELVLQVDEMGLEFAESSNPENFRDITMNSIVQVFNDLVTNKDPEASRPLYAYLITRPSCNLRWQALIEDAYQGKNIEEVSICFPSGQYTASPTQDPADDSEAHDDLSGDDEDMGDGHDVNDQNGALEPDDEPTGGYEEDAGLHDEDNDKLDQGQGAYDDTTEAGEVQTDLGHVGQNDFEGQEPQEADTATLGRSDVEASQVDEEFDEGAPVLGEGQVSAAEEISGDGGEPSASDFAQVAEELNDAQQASLEDGKYPDSFAHLCYKPGVCFCRPCLDEATILDMDEESAFRLESFSLVETARLRTAWDAHLPRSAPGQLILLSRHAYHLSDTSVSHSTIADVCSQALEANDNDTHEPSTAVSTADDNISTQDATAAAAVDVNENENENDDHLVSHADDANVAKVESDTSATATLDGDHHTDNFEGDFEFDADIGQMPADADNAAVEVNGGDLDEIDWRDYAGQGDENVPQESAVTSTKRPRSDEDDTVDAEHEQDVKRRRSDA